MPAKGSSANAARRQLIEHRLVDVDGMLIEEVVIAGVDLRERLHAADMHEHHRNI